MTSKSSLTLVLVFKLSAYLIVVNTKAEYNVPK